MIRFKKLVKEIHDTETLSARDIYNFYFLWATSLQHPELVQTAYGKEILNYYLGQLRAKYTRLFKRLVAKQILKYLQRNRVDADFPREVAPNLMNLSSKELKDLMVKTFRSDMRRRNDNWNMVADFVYNLENSKSVKDTFLYINQLNNAVHNTQTKVMDKFPNFYSELLKAFTLVDRTKNIHMLKDLVDKDVRDLWNQEEKEESSEALVRNAEYIEGITKQGLEKILKGTQKTFGGVLKKSDIMEHISPEDQKNVTFMTGIKMAIQDKKKNEKRNLKGYPPDFVRGYKSIQQTSWWDKFNARLTQLAAALGHSYGIRR